jgi:hypothetical protein
LLFSVEEELGRETESHGTDDNSPPVSTVGRQFSDANKPRHGRKNHFIAATPLCRP